MNKQEEKKLMERLENWVKMDNAKAFISAGVCHTYAVALPFGKAGGYNPVTPYLPLPQLEQYLMGIYHAADYCHQMQCENGKWTFHFSDNHQ
jgi:hypothetical protein